MELTRKVMQTGPFLVGIYFLVYRDLPSCACAIALITMLTGSPKVHHKQVACVPGRLVPDHLAIRVYELPEAPRAKTST